MKKKSVLKVLRYAVFVAPLITATGALFAHMTQGFLGQHGWLHDSASAPDQHFRVERLMGQAFDPQGNVATLNVLQAFDVAREFATEYRAYRDLLYALLTSDDGRRIATNPSLSKRYKYHLDLDLLDSSPELLRAPFDSRVESLMRARQQQHGARQPTRPEHYIEKFNKVLSKSQSSLLGAADSRDELDHESLRNYPMVEEQWTELKAVFGKAQSDLTICSQHLQGLQSIVKDARFEPVSDRSLEQTLGIEDRSTEAGTHWGALVGLLPVHHLTIVIPVLLLLSVVMLPRMSSRQKHRKIKSASTSDTQEEITAPSADAAPQGHASVTSGVSVASAQDDAYEAVELFASGRIRRMLRPLIEKDHEQPDGTRTHNPQPMSLSAIKKMGGLEDSDQGLMSFAKCVETCGKIRHRWGIDVTCGDVNQWSAARGGIVRSAHRCLIDHGEQLVNAGLLSP